MKRWLFNLAAALSAAALLLLAVLTTRSWVLGIADKLDYSTIAQLRNGNVVPGLGVSGESIDGKILLSCTVQFWISPLDPFRGGLQFHSEQASNATLVDRPWFDIGGLAFCHAPRTGGRTDSHTYLWIPGWLSLPVSALLPSIWIVQARRQRKRSKIGLCPTCGYDLRAHNPGDRCPECGIVPAATA